MSKITWFNNNATENSIQGHSTWILPWRFKVMKIKERLSNVPNWRSLRNVSNWNPWVWMGPVFVKGHCRQESTGKGPEADIQGALVVAFRLQRWHQLLRLLLITKNTNTVQDSGRWQLGSLRWFRVGKGTILWTFV